jgi:hypothetical protein
MPKSPESTQAVADARPKALAEIAKLITKLDDTAVLDLLSFIKQLQAENASTGAQRSFSEKAAAFNSLDMAKFKAPDPELRAVALWGQRNKSALAKAGKSFAGLCHSFAECQKASPTITAAQFLGKSAVA